MAKHYKATENSNNTLIQGASKLLAELNTKYDRSVTMQFTDSYGGRANIDLQRFTIPLWAAKKGITYLYYYVIHEFTHCFGQYCGHGAGFKACERGILGEYGITIDYARAYPKALYANGERVYHKTKR
jgi:hypothetical protein